MFYCLNHRTAGVMQAGGLCMSHPLFSRFFWRQPVSLQSEQRSVNPWQPAAQRQQQVHDPLQITCKQQTGQRHFSYLLERTYFLVCSSYYLRCSTRLDFRSYYIFFIFVYLFSKVIKPLSTKDRNTYVWNLGSLKPICCGSVMKMTYFCFLSQRHSDVIPMNTLYLSFSLVLRWSCTIVSMLSPSALWCFCSSHSASFSRFRATTLLLRASHSSTWWTAGEMWKQLAVLPSAAGILGKYLKIRLIYRFIDLCTYIIS